MTFLAVSEAARRLGVSTRQVQYLVASGELRQMTRGVVDEASVDRLLAVRGASPRRAWSELTAWGAVSLLSGGWADWMGGTQRSRLRGRLRELGADDLVRQARGRAVAHRYRGHSNAGRYLLDDLVASSAAGHLLGLTAADVVDGYVAAVEVDRLVSRHGLIEDDEGRVVLRATTFPLATLRDLADGSPVLAALDLAESLDGRERRAGTTALASALEAFRG